MSAPRRLAAAAIALSIASAASAARAETKRYSLSMMHFNVQYVAGGLLGFFKTPNPVLDLSAEQVEDSIVTQSFAPTLDMFVDHPTWGADVEMQGYMLDVLAARHPAVLDELRALAKSGQIEVVSFHYSDQLFMAYPREPWSRSADLTRATFAKYDVPLSDVVFCQEGQAGPGMADAMASKGWATLVFPKNLFSYQHANLTVAPLYALGPVDMVTSNDVHFDDGTNVIDVDWWFVDDGELLATGGIDPYLPEQFKTKPSAIADKVADLSAKEAAGFAITTVGKYVADAKTLVTPEPAPPLLDGTWQPNSTDGIHRWLGGFGLWHFDERDNDVRTLGAQAYRELLAAETAAAAAGVDATAEIAAGFRLLALGMVTDASGINPFRGEIEYGLAHQAEALRIARDVIERSRSALGGGEIVIDTAAGGAGPLASKAPEPPASDPLFAIDVSSGDRAVTTTWREIAPDDHEVTIVFGAGEQGFIRATFPGSAGDIVYTPGLSEAPASLARDAFTFDHFQLALSDGLLGLGPGRFVVMDQAFVHVSATIEPMSPDVLFEDGTAGVGETITWRFHVVDGDVTRAADVARRLNVKPVLVR